MERLNFCKITRCAVFIPLLLPRVALPSVSYPGLLTLCPFRASLMAFF